MLRQHLEKEKCNRLCNGTIYGEELFLKLIQGQLDEFVWGFLKINMKVYPHKHPQKEVYLFLKGKGTMQIEDAFFVPYQELVEDVLELNYSYQLSIAYS